MRLKIPRQKSREETLEHKIIKRYRWEYRLRSIGVKPFDFKKVSRVIPPALIGLSSWTLPVVLAATGASALVITGAVIGAKLIAMTYVSLVVGKEFREAGRDMQAGIRNGSLPERYARDTGVKAPPLERFLTRIAPERLVPGNDNRKSIFNIFSRKKKAPGPAQDSRQPTAPKPPKAA